MPDRPGPEGGERARRLRADPTAYLRSFGHEVMEELGTISTELDRQRSEQRGRRLSWRERWRGRLDV